MHIGVPVTVRVDGARIIYEWRIASHIEMLMEEGPPNVPSY